MNLFYSFLSKRKTKQKYGYWLLFSPFHQKKDIALSSHKKKTPFFRLIFLPDKNKDPLPYPKKTNGDPLLYTLKEYPFLPSLPYPFYYLYQKKRPLLTRTSSGVTPTPLR